ncbi:wax ester/triacylglycerol synthase family O-acyltransferase [Kineosporia sp. A_224]|uniref:wax ester/triacylglycerol synthase family O-acyltransferase n=1 Tax=Kineosporia sp. A_224 TaxID=1962180 RepID=UPI000B4B78DA|nr:wax ester/triacylglycerol synthase family O-acyltransferase [Kineosporia sp. A_224]
MGSHRMSNADAAWLGLDAPDNLMMITGVLRFAAPADWQRLREVVGARLLERFPTFSRRPVPSGSPFEQPVWDDDPGFDLDAHLVRVTVPRGDLDALVSRLLGTPLDMTRSPWQFHLVDVPADDEGPATSAVVARLHHCIADGIALASVLVSLTDDGPHAPVDDGAGLPAPSVLLGRRRTPQRPGVVRRAADGTSEVSAVVGVPDPATAWRQPRAALAAVRFGFGVVATAARLLLLSRDPRTRLRGRLGVDKRVAWTPPMPLADVKAVAAALDASVNDVLLAATAGALRRHLLAHGEPARDLRVFVPVNLRPVDVPVPRSLGNRFGLVLVPLPVSVPDTAARVRAVRAATDRLRDGREAAATFALVSLLGFLPSWLHGVVLRVLGSKTTAIVTNVPGPREQVWFAGAAVEGIVFWVPQTASVGLGVSLFSYAGDVTVGVAADAGLLPDPQPVADAVVAEVEALRQALAGTGASTRSRTEPAERTPSGVVHSRRNVP